MRIINIVGLSSFLNLYLKYNSFLGLIVFFNGILYHTNENNKIVRVFDTLFNFLLCINLLYYHYQELKHYAFISFISYMLNLYIYDYKHYINQDVSDFIHIIFVQYILSLALKKYILLTKF